MNCWTRPHACRVYYHSNAIPFPQVGWGGTPVKMVVHCCEFRPSREAAVNLFSDAAAAVREVYQEMDPALNIIVVFDKKWLTRGHTSHIGVGTLRASHKTGP